jgi:hypothetical protein
MLTLQAKPADYRRQVGYHHLALSVWARAADYRRQLDSVMRLKPPHPVTAQAARAGALLKAPINMWAIFNVAIRPTTTRSLNLLLPVDTSTGPN